MHTNRYFENKYEIWIYAVLIISSVFAAFLAVKNIKISPDSMRFGLISQQILSGNGIRVPIIRLEDTYTLVNGTIPFLDQMPLLPLLFALMGGVAPMNYLPAQILNSISHTAISVFTYLLMKNLYHNRAIALLAGMLVSFSYPLLWITNHVCSDPLFSALTVGALYFLILTRNSHHYQLTRNLFTASICACTAILTRNAGIALIPVFFWEAFIFMKNKRPGSGHASVIVAIMLPAITTVAMFVRNYIVSGMLRGFNQPSPGRSYLSAFSGTIKMIFDQFQIGEKSIILIIIVMTLFIFHAVTDADLRKEAKKYLDKGLDLIMVFIMSYTALIILTMAKQQWNFELRYMTPLAPFLYIIVVLLLILMWGKMTLTGASKLSLAALILSLSILAFGNFYKTYLNVQDFSSGQDKTYSILDSCTYKWIKENYIGNNLIATNRPFHLSFFGGYSSIALPHKRFNPHIDVPEDMESVLPDRMIKFGSRVLALFEQEEEQYEGRYLAGLFNKREDNDKFILLHDCPDGVVYRLRE